MPSKKSFYLIIAFIVLVAVAMLIVIFTSKKLKP